MHTQGAALFIVGHRLDHAAEDVVVDLPPSLSAIAGLPELCDAQRYNAHIILQKIAMSPTKSTTESKPQRRSSSESASPPAVLTSSTPTPVHASVLEEARRVGLLDGEKSEHVSFRAPPALVEAAKRETGVTSTSELGILALAMLAQPDPVVAFMRRTRGRLGKDHTLEY